MKSFVSKSVIEFKKNPNYWDAKNVFVDDVKLAYYDGSDQDALARNFVEGAYSSLAFIQIVQVLKELKKRIRTISSIVLQDATSLLLKTLT